MKFARLVSLLALLTLPACTKGGKGSGHGTADGGSDSDRISGTPLGTPLPERREGVSFLGANVDRNRFAPVYFGFDSTSVAGGERGKVQAVAEFAKSSGSTIIIAGFTDERGTPEYNRGLGERRALTVREDLISHGASAGQIQTVSFGEELPANSGSGEGAWAKNRRAEFGVVQ